MRIPKVVSTNNTKLSEETVNINFYSKPSMYVDVNEILEEEKTRTRFIKKIERIVRSSLEYREYVSFLKTEIDMTSCLFYKDIDGTNFHSVKLEIHHDPFTLYDLCEIVIMRRINEDESIDPFLVAEEVMKLHFMGLVGLVPISITVHKLVHSGEIFIPINKVYGNIKEFIDRYRSGMSPDHFNILRKAIEMTMELENSEEAYNPKVLERKAVYLNVKGQESVKKIEMEDECQLMA